MQIAERVRVAEFLRVLQRGQRVGGLARLRDDDHQRRRVGHAVAVAVLAGDLDRARDARQRLDPLLRDQARVVARAAGEDQHAVDLAPATASAFGPKRCGPIAGDAFERVGDRARLLEDLLLHEVAVRTELDARARRLDVDDRRARPARRARRRSRRTRAHVGDVAFLEIRDAARDRQQRRGVGGEEVVVLADADDQRAPLPRADDAAGLARRDHRDRVGAVELGDRRLHGARAGRRRRSRASARGRDAR